MVQRKSWSTFYSGQEGSFHYANLRVSNLDNSNLSISNLSISNLDFSNLDISDQDIIFCACAVPLAPDDIQPLRCIKDWLLSLKLWGSVYHTWIHTMILILGESLLAIKLSSHYWPCPYPFPKWREKRASERLQNPEQFPLVLGPLLLLQPRATTAVTRSHCGSRNSYLQGKYKSLCLTDSKN